MREWLRTLGSAACLALCAFPAPAQSAREVVFGGAGANPVTAVAIATDSPEARPAGASGMSKRVRGELGELSIRSLQRLAASMRLEPPETRTPMGAQIPLRVQMIARDGAVHVVDVVRTCTGLCWLRSADAEGRERLVRITAQSLAALLQEVACYRGSLSPAADGSNAGDGRVLECPYDANGIALDTRTLRQRIYGNGRALGSGVAKVDLAEERFLVRTPREYDPRSPAGLLVWVSAGERGDIPEGFFPALDELGLVVISAENSGNTRPVNDRIQLALDGAATAQTRFHIDPSRIYIAGISGGAKIATMAWGCFPDVFAGAVAIVGLASYKDTPAGREGIWPALFAQPRGEMFQLLTSHRLAAMTGPPDFNYRNMLPMAEAMRRDGLEIRIFDYADMGHTLPTPERFSEALRWVDEPARASRSEACARAQHMLEEFLAVHPAKGPFDDTALRSLDAVMNAAPWSPAAWKAVELLGSDAGGDAATGVKTRP